ncbi:hypothetical protein NE237_016123 [Protea cynaroides]|uniref:Transcription termination factor MTEF18, mitochondrial-like n=1 Tax=Protea cynaroides TaxID=273540 RepID=A0A9Q0KF90_9MAGN|nr:hypothetical protein NE237_016123 [Protea cynaroides]
MLIRLLSKTFLRFSVMFSLQLHCPWVSPSFPAESLNLRKNPCFNLQKIFSSYSIRACYTGSTARISRFAQTEAQDVLFDYLHCTRNFHFTDAEHISKNSPIFVRNLVSKVDNGQDIAQSLSRFLRFNPINEFEPFFESLGLSSSELSPLLPNLMFLSDDEIMLENYHVLCNYGIPRSKIGKMYKEGAECFRYDFGVLASKLQAYEELGLSKPTVIKLVICCPRLLIGGVNMEFFQVLEKLKGLGIKQDWLRGYLSDKRTYDWNKMLSTMCFLEEMGCSSKDIGRLFKNHPGFLLEGSGKNIYILVGLLLKLGLVMEELLFLLQQHPRILAGNFASNLCEAVQFMSEIGMEAEDIVKIVRTNTRILGSYPLLKPRTVLKRLKINPDKLCEVIKDDPQKFISIASQSKISSIEEIPGLDRRHKEAVNDGRHLLEKTTFLVRLGFAENSDEMLKALKQFRGRGDQLQERFNCLVNSGLDCHDVSNMIKVAPPVLNQTKDVIEKKIGYLVNCLGYPLESVVSFPTYLCYDIERIRLRFSMYVWLRERGAAKPMLALSTILACSDARFERYFVNLHPKGPSEWERLKKSSSLS